MQAGWVHDASAKEYSLGTESESVMIAAKLTSSPEPEIPSEFKGEAFKSIVTARFKIDKEGKFAVTLLEPSGNEDIDKIVMKTLKTWKFKPATLDGVAVASTRKIRVEIEVE